ncbi:MAG: coproporphyrinogen dehydrogenase HemZ [Lachnospiraceae bacterium]|jgi:coproporphyrinogen dehydrogenase HemZ|nr:coproporphyrinogen dehydrogenase HemZ [Lachnospiraceae bacterium]MCI8871766.1 coproporphyrinogen dehydrogenase HemZ [Lachnospiraceae bacterium]MCI9059135.1 coproporphyrinogen dehydrogenase HemZ [Lachnospiraceae bacterium]
MITVWLNEADFEYDIHSLVKAFYPGEEVKVFADAEKIFKLEEECAPLFRMEVHYRRQEPQSVELLLHLPAKGEQGGGSALAAPAHQAYILKMKRSAAVDFSDRKETKNRLKQTLYKMLSEYTGQTLPWGTLTGIRPTKIPMSMLEQGKKETEIQTYMADTYFTSGQKISLSIEIAKRELELLGRMDYQEGYSLYVGIPFCPSICSYCSFSSSPIGMWKERTEAYLDALEKEIDVTAAICSGKKLNTVYIGGGTPTTLSPLELDRLLTKIEGTFNFSDLLEYTVEAGRPDSITEEKLKVLRAHGISRISINPQTMKQETLDLIGRRHTSRQTVESFWLARELGFDNINMDLIVGLPGETIGDVRNTMEQIQALSPDNLTVHSLALKRAARFHMFPEDYQNMQMTNSWEIIDLTAGYAKEMGLSPYYLYRQKNMAGNFENVGYARQDKAGFYNILMMEEKQSILACGAGSISKRVSAERGIERCENVKDVALYIEKIDEMIERKRKLFMDF